MEVIAVLVLVAILVAVFVFTRKDKADVPAVPGSGGGPREVNPNEQEK